jgi:prophage antirepressor-like protein
MARNVLIIISIYALDVQVLDTLGGPQKMNVINESGLYGLAFRSRKPEAIKFRKWVTSEVLPTIRKTGAYIQDNLTEKQLIELQAKVANLTAINHNLRLEAKHFAAIAELESGRAERWCALSEFGQLSTSNGKPKTSKRRGAWVANGKVSIQINDQQMTFNFKTA